MRELQAPTTFYLRRLVLRSQAGVVGAVPAAKPKATAEAIDRATCLYETEWQVAEAAIASGDTVVELELPKRRMLSVPKSRAASTCGTSLVWRDSLEPSKSVVVRIQQSMSRKLIQ